MSATVKPAGLISNELTIDEENVDASGVFMPLAIECDQSIMHALQNNISEGLAKVIDKLRFDGKEHHASFSMKMQLPSMKKAPSGVTLVFGGHLLVSRFSSLESTKE